MKLNSAAIADVTVAFRPKTYKRIFLLAHRATPLGTGPSAARFSSVKGNFTTLYAAVSLATAIAETIVRDRFEGGVARWLFPPELANRCVVAISAAAPLNLIDLRTDGCFKLGVSTDIASAKGWDLSCELAQHIHDHCPAEGFLYRSRLTGGNCVAVFNRAIASKLVADNVTELIAVPGLTAALTALKVDLIR